MPALSADTLSWFLVFFVPGFISIKVYGLLVPSDERNWSNSLLEAVSYSCINFAVLYVLIAAVSRPGYREAQPSWYYLAWFVLLFVAPTLWPVLGRMVLTARLLRGKIVHPTPKAWDYYFGQGKPCWVLVHLKDGNLVGGLYGEESFASSYPKSEDIYLQETWRLGNHGEFVKKVPQTHGTWVSGQAVDFIEFFTFGGEENGERGKQETTAAGV